MEWLPAQLRELLRDGRNRVRRPLQQRALRRLFSADVKRIIIGSSGSHLAGWVPTDREVIDLLIEDTWTAYFGPGDLDAILAEHVWEHLSAEQAAVAASTCYRFLKPGGHLRVAVPDGFHPDPDYVATVKPPADDHLVLYDYCSFRSVFTNAGFEVRLYEYFDENRQFHYENWNSVDGMILRSRRFDRRNANGHLGYTSIVLDAIKPIACFRADEAARL